MPIPRSSAELVWRKMMPSMLTPGYHKPPSVLGRQGRDAWRHTSCRCHCHCHCHRGTDSQRTGPTKCHRHRRAWAHCCCCENHPDSHTACHVSRHTRITVHYTSYVQANNPITQFCFSKPRADEVFPWATAALASLPGTHLGHASDRLSSWPTSCALQMGARCSEGCDPILAEVPETPPGGRSHR